jgi:hypothetical protein
LTPEAVQSAYGRVFRTGENCGCGERTEKNQQKQKRKNPGRLTWLGDFDDFGK